MRLTDWETRLSAFVAENRDQPYQWGAWDCLLFACAAVEAITGEDPASPYRGLYSDKKGSTEALREFGQGTLLRTVDHHWKRKKAAFAHRGDLVWFAGSVGVCMGVGALFVGEERLAEKAGIVMREGLVSVPRALWQKAWTV
jgi:hypothetical protein